MFNIFNYNDNTIKSDLLNIKIDNSTLIDTQLKSN